MEKDKLNDACDTAFLANYFPSATESPDPRWELFADGFRQGAEWLMGQPLSERMTEEERNYIRKLNSIIESMFDMLPDGHVNQRRVIQVENMLIRIFGKEMFEQ